MKTVFDKSTRDELLGRINLLTGNSMAQWGKMTVYQMLTHCTRWDDMMVGKLQVKRMFLGRLIGKMALKNVLKNDKPLGKNSPTATELISTEKAGDIALQKAEWGKRINDYASFTNSNFIHPFFGPMTKEQVGQFVYKHHDHHLRQFGV
ncbi:hypothetical protein GCM10028808_08680 [Spirosoma migulaei]